MKTIVTVFAGALLIVIGAASAFASEASDIYAAKCAICHGPNGEGTQTGPPHKGDDFIINSSAEEVKNVVLSGRAGGDKLHPEIMLDMPGGLVNEAEADLLVEYMKVDLQK